MIFILLVKVPSHSQYKMASTAQHAAMVIKILKIMAMGDTDAFAALAKDQQRLHFSNIARNYSLTMDAWHLAMDAGRIAEYVAESVANSNDPNKVYNILMAVANAQTANDNATMASKYSSKYKDLYQQYEDAMVANDFTTAAALCAAMTATMDVVNKATNAVGHARGQATYTCAKYTRYSNESAKEVFDKEVFAMYAFNIANNAAHLANEVINLINEKTDVGACIALALKNAAECAAAEAAEAAADKRAADKRAAEAADKRAKAAAAKRVADADEAADKIAFASYVGLVGSFGKK